MDSFVGRQGRRKIGQDVEMMEYLSLIEMIPTGDILKFGAQKKTRMLTLCAAPKTTSYPDLNLPSQPNKDFSRDLNRRRSCYCHSS